MGKREKKQKPSNFDHGEDDEEQVKPSKLLIVLSSDDEEANEDLSLKIVEKAMSRASTTDQYDAVLDDGMSDGGDGMSGGGIDLSPSDLQEAEVVTDLKDEKKKKEKKKKKSGKFETAEEAEPGKAVGKKGD